MGLDFTVIAKNWDYFLWGRTLQGEVGGLLLTVLMALAAGFLSLVLGIGLALAAWLGSRPLRAALTFMADLVRSIPLVLVIFWIYFLVPALFKTPIPGALSVILALAWFSSGAVMYVTLAGLEALPRGHREAGAASGLTEGQVFTAILLPQAMRNLVPSYVALFASMIKDTSLAFILNVPELTMTASQVNTRAQIYPAEIFLFTGAVYFLLCAGLSGTAHALAHRLQPGRARP
ncbi:MAG: amino acid ABC transporter permease [Holophaga sp.]|nr:amino acid ABC transporter permease [Holophaga sp.]